MKKPEKLHVMEELIDDRQVLSNRESFRKGFNWGIEAYECSLPSEEEIQTIILKCINDTAKAGWTTNSNDVAKAISRRIGNSTNE